MGGGIGANVFRWGGTTRALIGQDRVETMNLQLLQFSII